MTIFLDTNIQLYAALEGTDEEAFKRERARALLKRNDVALSIQVLQEFVNQALHPRRSQPLSWDKTLSYVEVFREFDVRETTFSLFEHGLELVRRHSFSFWDAMIVAAAIAQGCDTLYTEDMQHGRTIEGVRIVDPFR